MQYEHAFKSTMCLRRHVVLLSGKSLFPWVEYCNFLHVTEKKVEVQQIKKKN
jgi:hypothetical protein